jgi:DNA-binding protein HU-beta
MTKAELVAKIAEKAKLTKVQAEAALAAFQCAVSTELVNDGKITLPGFGTFSALKKAARTGRNPQTGKPLKIAAKKVGKFTAGKNLKNLDVYKASCKSKPAKPAPKAVAAKAKKK